MMIVVGHDWRTRDRTIILTGNVIRELKDAGLSNVTGVWWMMTRACTLCAQDVPHHTNSRTSIGGGERFIVWDLHAVEDTGGVGLAECTAYDVVKAAAIT